MSFGGIDLGDAAWARLLGQVAHLIRSWRCLLCRHSNETPLWLGQCFVTSFTIEAPLAEA
jgi:hypothetical protein